MDMESIFSYVLDKIANDKRMFIALVVKVIQNHPEWMSEMLIATQTGVTERLKREYRQKNDLASALLSFFNSKGSNRFITDKAIKSSGWMLRGLRILRDMYEGAAIYTAINSVVEEVEANVNLEDFEEYEE